MDVGTRKVVLIVVVIVAALTLVGIGILLLATGVGVATAGRLQEARAQEVRTNAAALRDAVTLYLVQSPGGACPSVADLVASRVIEGSRSTDPWGNAFVVTCEGDAIRVASAGPDGTAGTPDDISTP